MKLSDSSIERALLDSLRHLRQAFPQLASRAASGSDPVIEATGRVDLAAASELPPSVAIAYSGGLDSSVLLHALTRQLRPYGVRIFAFHIHHGLSPNADQWLSHCAQQCREQAVEFDSRRVEIRDAGTGIEEAARHRRYHALGELCLRHQVPFLMTAHHQDDQAETVLMQMLRGSGVAGLSGMERANLAAGLLGSGDIAIARPLLSIGRAELERYALDNGLEYIQDESNDDLRYTRNLIRQKVMPILDACFPGFQERVARTAGHARSAQSLLAEIAEEDLDRCLVGQGLDIQTLASFSKNRIDNVLRHWFSMRSIRMPSTAWLDEMHKQILLARTDAQLCVSHPECEIRRYRGCVYIVPKEFDQVKPVPCERMPFVWQGEHELPFPSFNGFLSFVEHSEGVSAEWLREQSLFIAPRCGGERLKLAPNRPSRTLKQHYQALGVPPWIRERLPVIYAHEQLLLAAGVGMDCHNFSQEPGRKFMLVWRESGTLRQLQQH